MGVSNRNISSAANVVIFIFVLTKSTILTVILSSTITLEYSIHPEKPRDFLQNLLPSFYYVKYESAATHTSTLKIR
jgi:hypothetical protein